jgi:hypothetical protein
MLKQIRPNGTVSFHGVAGPITGLAHPDDLPGVGEGLLDSPPCRIAGDQIFRGGFEIGGDQREPVTAVVGVASSGFVVADQNDADGSAAK